MLLGRGRISSFLGAFCQSRSSQHFLQRSKSQTSQSYAKGIQRLLFPTSQRNRKKPLDAPNPLMPLLQPLEVPSQPQINFSLETSLKRSRDAPAVVSRESQFAEPMAFFAGLVDRTHIAPFTQTVVTGMAVKPRQTLGAFEASLLSKELNSYQIISKHTNFNSILLYSIQP